MLFRSLAWLGFAPQLVIGVVLLNLAFQFFVHTQAIPNLGWLEYVFNTPSIHRSHHARNPCYIDRNYAGVLVIWDRLFGSYVAERDDTPCDYGTLKPVNSHNPLWVSVVEWRDMLREALAASRNLVSIRILKTMGLRAAIDHATRFGFDKNSLPNNLTLALGSMDATPLQVVSGYAVFANGGYKVNPYLISKITDASGKTISEAKPDLAGDENNRVIDERNAFLMDSMLRDVTIYGTAAKASAQLKRTDLAGKTGTTNNGVDVLFIGYSPSMKLLTAIWMGNDDNTKMVALTGGNLPAQLWHDYMAVAEAKETPRGLPGIDYRPPTAIDPGQLSERKPPKKQPQVAKAQETSIETPKPSEPVKQPNFIEKLFGVLPQ